MELRNADLAKTIPVSVVLEILTAFTAEMADRSMLLESGDWTERTTRSYELATRTEKES